MLITEMSHKELLLAAARAYDLPFRHWVPASHPSVQGLLLPNNRVFNPILNPEQAMWLSLEMRMSHSHDQHAARVDVPWAQIETQVVPYDREPMEALCLAIVRAAAAVAAKGLTVKDIPASLGLALIPA